MDCLRKEVVGEREWGCGKLKVEMKYLLIKWSNIGFWEIRKGEKQLEIY